MYCIYVHFFGKSKCIIQGRRFPFILFVTYKKFYIGGLLYYNKKQN